jgi:type I restriction enzyme M protein
MFGGIDHNLALNGDDLREFVDNELFPYLRGFTTLWGLVS